MGNIPQLMTDKKLVYENCPYCPVSPHQSYLHHIKVREPLAMTPALDLHDAANYQQMENCVARIAAAALPDSLVQIVL
jgi:hypothetical protein